MKSNITVSSVFVLSLFLCGISLNAHAANLPAGTYTLTLAHSAKCMDVPNGSTSNSIQLQQWSCNSSSAQKFDINPTDSGYYKLLNVASGKAMDIRSGSTANGGVVQQYSWNNSNAQHFYFQNNGSGFILRNRNSGKCVELMNSADYDGGVLVQMPCSGAAQQTFSITPTNGVNQTVVDGRYTLKAVHSGKCMDVPGSSTSNSITLQQYTCNATAAQQFDFVYVGGSQYEIKNANSGKCVDVAGGWNINGTAVQQYTCNQTTAQRWLATGLGDGKFHIKSAMSGNKLLEINGGLTSNGAGTQIWSDAGYDHQKWTMEPVAANATIADGVYSIKATHSSKCIDVPNSSLNPGQSLQQYSCNGSSAQSFVVRHQADGYYKISNTNSHLALSVRDFSENNSAVVEQGEELNGNNQLFRIVAQGANYVIRPKSGYKCFDINGASTSNGAGVIQYDCNYSNNQIFQFQLISSDTSYNPGPAANSDTTVLLHGFAGWGRNEMFGMKYWGGGWNGSKDLQEYLKSNGHKTVTVAVGPLSSNWDRAIEMYYQLKGGCVDYGAAHAAQHNHARYGRCYTALLPNWSSSQKIHIIAHSQGGQTARVLLKLLRDGAASENYASGTLFSGGRNWVRSISTIASPHDGTTLTEFFNPLDITEKLVTQISRAAGMISGDNVVYDLKLDQWSLTRNANESWYDYFNRVKSNSTWANTNDNCLYDLSTEGAPYTYGATDTYYDVYYFTFSNQSTFQGFWDGRQYPEATTFMPFIPQSIFMGQYGSSAWWSNDSVVNTISMKGPTGTPMQTYNGYPAPGVWQDMGTRYGWDHLDVVGLFTLKNINPMYLAHEQLLKSLN